MGFAQAWQDHMLWRNFFAGQRQGLYIDIVTNDPVKVSNTAFFDVCLGWSGVCIEPQKVMQDRIRAVRPRCQLVPSCVTAETNQSTRYGMKGHTIQGVRQFHGCLNLLDALRGLQPPLHLENVTIDLLSIDVEGEEPRVLRCLPWRSLDIRLVLIETNKARDTRSVDAFFHAMGYVNAATFVWKLKRPHTPQWLDNLYVRLPGGPLVYPPGQPQCDTEDLKLNRFCGPWRALPPQLAREWICDAR